MAVVSEPFVQMEKRKQVIDVKFTELQLYNCKFFSKSYQPGVIYKKRWIEIEFRKMTKFRPTLKTEVAAAKMI